MLNNIYAIRNKMHKLFYFFFTVRSIRLLQIVDDNYIGELCVRARAYIKNKRDLTTDDIDDARHTTWERNKKASQHQGLKTELV